MRLLPWLRQRLFRRRRDEQRPIVLTQRRIFIVPTQAGLLFGLVLAMMLTGAINYNLGLGHALVFLLAGLGLVAMVHTFRNLVALRLLPGHAEAVFAGDVARFSLHLENPRRYTRRALDVGFGKTASVALDIPAAGRASVAIPFPALARGRLTPGRITLSTRYPLGLFLAWSYPHPPLSCLVYPRPIHTPLPSSSPTPRAGDRQGGSGQEDFNGFRLRQASDPIRHIAWKAVARDFENRPLLVKQFAGGASEELWLDWALTPADSGTETRLSILAGWVLAAAAASADYGLRLPGGNIAPAQGATHRDACLEALALFSEAGKQVAN